MPALLEAQRLAKHYGAVHALEGVIVLLFGWLTERRLRLMDIP